MHNTFSIALWFVMLPLTAGCASLAPAMLESLGFAAAPLPGAATLTTETGETASLERCEPLGLVTARAECACYDRMSYEHLKGQASHKAVEAARAQYPDSTMVQISSVDMYLNNAIAHGVAYRCTPPDRS